MRTLGKLAGLALIGSVAACADIDRSQNGSGWNAETVAAMPAPKEPMLAALREGYLRLARAELAEYDWNDGADFLAKARMAAAGERPPPYTTKERKITNNVFRAQLSAAEFELIALVNSKGARRRAPLQIARAQIDWECWIQEAEEGHQKAEIEACRKAFEKSLAIAKKAAGLPKNFAVVLPEKNGKIGGIEMDAKGRKVLLNKAFAAASERGTLEIEESEVKQVFAKALSARPIPPTFFRVFFDLNSSTVDQKAMDVIRRIVSDIRRRKVAEVVLIGHTDAVGADGVNQALSRRRAMRIRDVIASSLDPKEKVRFIIGGHGESELALPTPDKERRNRRVEVTVR